VWYPAPALLHCPHVGRYILIALLFAGLSSTFRVGDVPWSAPFAEEPTSVGEPSLPIDTDSSEQTPDLDSTEPVAARVGLAAAAPPRAAEARISWPLSPVPESRVPPVPVPPPIA